jgi:uncharacterized protein YdeI (YjbR/CyaY-like superfamily)
LSSVNVRKVKELTDLGRMQAAGLAAFEARKEDRSGIYSHEQGEVELPEPYQGLLRENAAAWAFFQGQAPSYRKATSWWVASAKKEETRRKRLDSLARYSARGERVPQLTWKKASETGG